MYIIQYYSFCIHLKYLQNEYKLSSTYPEMSSLRDESKHTFPRTPRLLWVQCTSLTADFLSFSIPVTEHHMGLNTGCRCFHCLILQLKANTGWSQSIIYYWYSAQYPTKTFQKVSPLRPALYRLRTPLIFSKTLQHTVCNSGKKCCFRKYLNRK